MSFSRPGGTLASRWAGEPGSTQAVATDTAAKTPMAAWHSCGMKERVLIAPPSRGGETSASLGMFFEPASAMFMSGAAARRMASSRALSAASAFSTAWGSAPVTPTLSAASTMTGMPLSISVTATPSTTSTARPVGSSVPQTEPSASRKSMGIGEAVPGTPSIAASPA